LIAGSCGLTSSIKDLQSISDAGAGAVVLKSIFEEQIRHDSEKFIMDGSPEAKTWKESFDSIVSKSESYYDEAFDYLTSYATDHTLEQYLSFIADAKKSISIPVIASINCSTSYNWPYFASRIQKAGADALELNIYVLPSDPRMESAEIEATYFKIISEVRKFVSIPVSVKTGYYFSGLAGILVKLSKSGISGLTLFNRPYNPDIDIDKIEVSASNIFSTETEYSNTLRWVALMSGKLKCDIAASTGIHNYQTVIKQILAGADAVQMASLFYRKSFSVLPEMIDNIEKWMEKHSFSSISDFKGLLSVKNIQNPASYERVQFIRLFTEIE